VRPGHDPPGLTVAERVEGAGVECGLLRQR
jgi:hypothetical protein